MSSVQPRLSYNFYHLNPMGPVMEVSLEQLAQLRADNDDPDNILRDIETLNAAGLSPLMAEKAKDNGLLVKTTLDKAFRMSDELYSVSYAPSVKVTPVVAVQPDVTYDPALKAMMLKDYTSAANGDIRLSFESLEKQFMSVALRGATHEVAAPRADNDNWGLALKAA